MNKTNTKTKNKNKNINYNENKNRGHSFFMLVTSTVIVLSVISVHSGMIVITAQKAFAQSANSDMTSSMTYNKGANIANKPGSAAILTDQSSNPLLR